MVCVCLQEPISNPNVKTFHYILSLNSLFKSINVKKIIKTKNTIVCSSNYLLPKCSLN